MKRPRRNTSAVEEPRYPTLTQARASSFWLSTLGAAVLGANSLGACAIPEAEAAESTSRRPDAGPSRVVKRHPPDASTGAKTGPDRATSRRDGKPTVIDFEEVDLEAYIQGPVVMGIRPPHGRFGNLMKLRTRFDPVNGEDDP